MANLLKHRAFTTILNFISDIVHLFGLAALLLLGHAHFLHVLLNAFVYKVVHILDLAFDVDDCLQVLDDCFLEALNLIDYVVDLKGNLSIFLHDEVYIGRPLSLRKVLNFF